MSRQHQTHMLLENEVADAWDEYRDAIRDLSGQRYEEVESWAGARLNQRLERIKSRRTKLQPAASAA